VFIVLVVACRIGVCCVRRSMRLLVVACCGPAWHLVHDANVGVVWLREQEQAAIAKKEPRESKRLQKRLARRVAAVEKLVLAGHVAITTVALVAPCSVISYSQVWCLLLCPLVTCRYVVCWACAWACAQNISCAQYRRSTGTHTELALVSCTGSLTCWYDQLLPGWVVADDSSQVTCSCDPPGAAPSTEHLLTCCQLHNQY
jgi:hypothetical protein